MADSVFGNPVTDETVRLVYPKIEEITAKHRAEVALLYKNSEGKDVNVNTFVHNLKTRYGTGTSTLCMIYNATGHTLRFDREHNWEGRVWESPCPQIIQNGQWGGFLHVRGRLMGPSKAAVVYHGMNDNEVGCDWMLSWDTPRRNFANHVYTEIRGAGHYKTDHWGYIEGKLGQQSVSHSDTWNGCFSIISVGEGSSPELVATLTLDGLDSDFRVMACAVPQSLDSASIDDDGDDEIPDQ